MEDIDSPRVKPWAVQQAIDDLQWLGMDWDFGPDRGGPQAPYIQTERRSEYQFVLRELKARELIYPCTCSRSDILEAASAPHVGQEGPRYPATCAWRTAKDADSLPERTFAWRFRTDSYSRKLTFTDRLQGVRNCHLFDELGDFVVCKADGTPAYQLAVVCDDHAMGITEVVRGDDLLPSTFRQLALYQSLGWVPPEFAHLPLVIGEDGRRLAKRHGDTRLSVLREQGKRPEPLIGQLAWSCGWQTEPVPCTAADLLSRFQWNSIPQRPFVFTPAMWSSLMD